LGKKDAPVHEKVRIYLTCGAGHGGTSTRELDICEHSLSVIDHWPISRALLKALDRWVTEGIEPPPSSYPRIDRKELITAAQHKKQFPKIPGMRHPGKNLQPPRVNYGDKFWQEGIITVVPPEMGEPYITLVPNFDSDGNSIGGIRLPELQVPLGTYQGWNPRQAKYGAPEPINQYPFWQQEKRIEDPKAIKVDPKIYDAYVGQYEIEAGAVITILKKNNSLFAIVSEQEKFELSPESETKYFIKGTSVRVTFIKDDQGAVIQVLIHTDRGDMKGRRVEVEKMRR
jgi:hypothetical protein